MFNYNEVRPFTSAYLRRKAEEKQLTERAKTLLLLLEVWLIALVLWRL